MRSLFFGGYVRTRIWNEHEHCYYIYCCWFCCWMLKNPHKFQVGFSFSFAISCDGLLYPWYMYAHFVGSFSLSHSHSYVVLCKITAAFFGALRVFISCFLFISQFASDSHINKNTWIHTKSCLDINTQIMWPFTDEMNIHCICNKNTNNIPNVISFCLPFVLFAYFFFFLWTFCYC